MIPRYSHLSKSLIYICKYSFSSQDFDGLFRLFSEDNIQVITEISENASKEYFIERILENIRQIWNELKFETTIHKPNVFKLKYEKL
jgi:hypothetical protein